MQRAISRAELRQLMAKVLRTDAELVAFLGDYLPDVAARLSDGMDRLSKVNLLLELHACADVLSLLTKAHPESVKRHLDDNVEAEASEDELGAEARNHELRQLRLGRAARMRAGKDTQELDQQIARLVREQRQGPQLHETDELSGRYRLYERVGRGGFANVWQAYDEKTDQLVAIKVLHPDQASPQNLRRFRSGASQMMMLNSHHVVRVLAEPTSDRGFHYFVMEYMRGGDLSAAMQRGLTKDRAMSLLFQIGEALSEAHARGLLHRDVKPQNILLDRIDDPQNAKLTDFDLARSTLDSHGTRTGSMMGTFLYAAPETLEDSKAVDARADVYALGMTALFVHYGRELPSRSFQNGDWLIQRLSCSDAEKAALRKAVQWEPKERYSTIAEFMTELRAAMAVTPADSRLPAFTPGPRRWLRIGIGAGTAAATAGGVWLASQLLLVRPGEAKPDLGSSRPLAAFDLAVPPAELSAVVSQHLASKRAPSALSGIPSAKQPSATSPHTARSITQPTSGAAEANRAAAEKALKMNSVASPAESFGPLPAKGSTNRKAVDDAVNKVIQGPVKEEEPDEKDTGGAPEGGGVLGATAGHPPPPPEAEKPLPKPKVVPAILMKQDKISSGDDPHLPDIVKAKRRGSVVVGSYKVCIGQDGSISSVDVVQGIPDADDSIIATLRGWRYKPQAIPVCFIQFLEFHIY